MYVQTVKTGSLDSKTKVDTSEKIVEKDERTITNSNDVSINYVKFEMYLPIRLVDSVQDVSKNGYI